ncbi:MAG: hypothetical protein PUP93_27965 [Rhizonema sp. NSF051]|nr:hypothetical protein [Rhizonema sp. NSF051]
MASRQNHGIPYAACAVATAAVTAVHGTTANHGSSHGRCDRCSRHQVFISKWQGVYISG